VAVIDTGVDYNHPDIRNNIWNNNDEIADNKIDDDGNGFVDDILGWDFVNRDNDPIDDNGHGTHCAGIIAAEANNTIGIAGVAPKCNIMPLKAIGRSGKGTSIEAARAIRYAADNGADVISMSFGEFKYSFLLKKAIDYAYNKEIVLVAGAGNYDVETKFYPAAFPNVISVSATDKYDDKAAFSNHGTWVDIASPGQGIISLQSENTSNIFNLGVEFVSEDKKYCTASGTSSACPYVSGVAALILSKDPNLKPDEVKKIICNSTDRFSSRVNKKIGTGRLNAYRALSGDSNSRLLKIEKPFHSSEITGKVNITISIKEKDFKFYILEYCQKTFNQTENWIEIINSSEQFEDKNIFSMDTNGLNEGLYKIRLKTCYDTSFHFDSIEVLVNNKQDIFNVDNKNIIENYYDSIQEAIWNSGNGDTVFVYSGIYDENLRIFKSINLYSADKDNTIINGNMESNVILIEADNVNISGFTIYNSSVLCSGIYIINSDNCVISNNKVYVNNIGIKLQKSNNNMIKNNSFEYNLLGCRMVGSNHNKIIDNNFVCTDITKLFYEHASFKNSYLNKWNNNYWDDWIGLKSPIFNKLPKRISCRITDLSFFAAYRTFKLRSNFDWNPSEKPHEQ